jgi:putative transposase
MGSSAMANAKLRQVDVLVSQGRSVAEAVRSKKGRLWLNDGSCIRLRPEYPNLVWSCDFVESRAHDGRKFRMLNLIDEFTRECLAIRVDRKLRSTDVIDVLSELLPNFWIDSEVI